MKALKLLFVMLLLSWQASATGFSHNMLVAHKMLNAKEKSVCEKNQKHTLPLHFATRPTVVKPATHPATEPTDKEATLQPEDTAVSLSQHIARWVVRLVTVSGEVLTETLVSVFSFSPKSAFPANATLISLTENILCYLLVPLRAMT